MNYSTAVFLINNKVRAVLAAYEAGDNKPKTLFKSFDPDLKIGDLVLVPSSTRHGFTVVKITDVDVDFDIETSQKVEWIVSTIDLDPYRKMLEAEQQAISTIQSAQKTKKRDELRKALLADAEGKLNDLPIAAIGQDKQIGGAT